MTNNGHGFTRHPGGRPGSGRVPPALAGWGISEAIVRVQHGDVATFTLAVQAAGMVQAALTYLEAAFQMDEDYGLTDASIEEQLQAVTSAVTAICVDVVERRLRAEGVDDTRFFETLADTLKRYERGREGPK